jgi:CDP-glycerol glycerophosphotransferase
MTDVSVIVIVYNDADRLPDAVRSALDQSHRNVEVIIVDDASTDGTREVADALAAENPDRVRVIHRTENSGAGGQPRNDGIEAARSTYVMFLDSDDTLDRHACRNLVATAEETGAELVSGCCWRVFPDRKEEHPWFRRLYRERAVYSSVRECPDLMYDTLCTNKLYRRDFLEREQLRFPSGLFYEDLLFCTEIYLAARMIAVIPHRVYNWMVFENSDRPSVTNQRARLRNFADRLEIFRRIGGVYDRYGADDLKLSRDVKFLNYDLPLYVRTLRSRDPEYRSKFLELAGGYLNELDPRAYEEAQQIKAIIGLMVAKGDYEGAVAAVDYVPKKGGKARLATELVERDGRVYWSADHLDDERARSILDVTDLGFHSTPLKNLTLGGRVTEMALKGGTLRVAGDVVNPLGRIDAGTKLRAELEFRDRRRSRRVFGIPAKVEHAGGRIRWRTDTEPIRHLRPLGFVDQTWSLRLRLHVGDDQLVIRLTADEAVHDHLEVPVRPRLTRLAGDHLQAYVPESGELALRIVARSRPARWTIAVLGTLAKTPYGRRWLQALLRAEKGMRDSFQSSKTKVNVYSKVFTRLPIRRRTIVFESHLGKQYSDNPKYIYEELRRSGAKYTAIWSYAGSPSGFPKDAKLVRRNSWAYYRALARAHYWIDNQGFPRGVTKRPQTTYIQTWHGSAYKLMGSDSPEIKRGTQGQRNRHQQMVDRFDYFVVRSEHDAATLVKGLGVRAELIRSGYPRNDALVTGGAGDALRKKLKLTDDRKVVLYAPTFRAGPNGRPEKRFELPFDVERFAKELGETHVLLVRPHYLSSAVLPPSLRGTARSVADVHDVTSLLQITDVLITDYSSVMFDYALLDRPMLFFAPDLEDYVRSRGSYFDLTEEAPGPVIRDEDQLFAALADLDGVGTRYAKQRKRFAENFGEYDQGTAAKQIVERFFS